MQGPRLKLTPRTLRSRYAAFPPATSGRFGHAPKRPHRLLVARAGESGEAGGDQARLLDRRLRVLVQGEPWHELLREERCGGSAGLAGGDDAVLVGEDDRLDAVAEVELHQDAADVALDGGLGHDESFADLAVRESARDEH